MPDPSSSENSIPDSHSHVYHVSFGRLREDGPGALAPAPDLGIEAVFLVGEVHRWFNAYNLKTSRCADDLFAASAGFSEGLELFPKGAELVTLTLELIFENNPEPCRVALKPPDKLVVRKQEFADRIRTFLTRRGLIEISRGPVTTTTMTDCQTTPVL